MSTNWTILYQDCTRQSKYKTVKGFVLIDYLSIRAHHSRIWPLNYFQQSITQRKEGTYCNGTAHNIRNVIPAITLFLKLLLYAELTCIAAHVGYLFLQLYLLLYARYNVPWCYKNKNLYLEDAMILMFNLNFEFANFQTTFSWRIHERLFFIHMNWNLEMV